MTGKAAVELVPDIQALGIIPDRLGHRQVGPRHREVAHHPQGAPDSEEAVVVVDQRHLPIPHPHVGRDVQIRSGHADHDRQQLSEIAPFPHHPAEAVGRLLIAGAHDLLRPGRQFSIARRRRWPARPGRRRALGAEVGHGSFRRQMRPSEGWALAPGPQQVPCQGT